MKYLVPCFSLLSACTIDPAFFSGQSSRIDGSGARIEKEGRKIIRECDYDYDCIERKFSAIMAKECENQKTDFAYEACEDLVYVALDRADKAEPGYEDRMADIEADNREAEREAYEFGKKLGRELGFELKDLMADCRGDYNCLNRGIDDLVYDKCEYWYELEAPSRGECEITIAAITQRIFLEVVARDQRHHSR